jgi:3-deoxy-D-manno-octulosonic-acid transferase
MEKIHPSPIIWMHCASVGEFEQGRPIIEKLKAENKNLTIVLTFFSPSGFEACENYKEDKEEFSNKPIIFIINSNIF